MSDTSDEFATIKSYGSENSSKAKQTNNNYTYDIYGSDSYLWYSSTTPDDKKYVPYVILQEFENRTDLLAQRILYILRSAFKAEAITRDNSDFTAVYKNLYQVRPTGNVFKFPYFGKYPFSINTTYSQIDVKNSDGLGEEVAKIRASVLNMDKSLGNFADKMRAGINSEKGLENWLVNANLNAGTDNIGLKGYNRRFGVTQGAQAIKSWSSAETGQYETTFNLINKTSDFAKTHYRFIRTFMRALAPSFPNTMMVKVPYVYEIFIPSVLHIPLGFVGNFSATPKGSSFVVSSDGEQGMIVPEAWEIHITFNSLFPISVQLLDTINDNYGTNYGFTPANGQFKKTKETIRNNTKPLDDYMGNINP